MDVPDVDDPVKYIFLAVLVISEFRGPEHKPFLLPDLKDDRMVRVWLSRVSFSK